MPAVRRKLTTDFAPILDFAQYRVLYFHLKVENLADSDVEFAFGNPNDGAQIEGIVGSYRAHDFDDRPLVGILWARSTIAQSVTISFW